MLSQFKNVSSRLITSIFISGISEAFITKLIANNYPNILKENKVNKDKVIYPEILFYYPQDDNGLSPSFLEYIFIDGINIEFNLQPPKFIPEVLTDEKGERTYLYSIRLYDKIEINHRNYYLPYALSIWSPVNNSEAFKNILTEFYRIIKTSDKDIDDSTLINYHNLEFIHMIIFLTDIILPPNNSKIILNFHYSSVEFIFPSLTEIPNNEEYIQLLFDCLEISTIIKLWCSILCEKHIIFLANQGYLLFSITQGLLSLIFPFAWLYTYIPILPKNLKEYLDSPIPYIIGIISDNIDINELNEKYPGHVICDLNSGTVNKNGVSFLSNIEEDIIKKKIKYLYNPKLYEVEDIYLDENDKKKYNNKNFELEDIDMTKSFGENIHYIFFRIFRYQLSVIQSNFVKNKVFDVQIFLEDFCQDEMRDFWDKLTSSESFDNFLMNLNKIEDTSFSKILSKILSIEGNDNDIINNEINDIDNNYNKNGINKKEEMLVIKYNLPKNISYILNQFIEIDDINDDYSNALKNLLEEYNNTLEKIKDNNLQKINLNNEFTAKKRNFHKKGNRKSIFSSVLPKTSLDKKDKMKRIQSKIDLLREPPQDNSSEKKSNDNDSNGLVRRESLYIIQKPFKNLFYLYGLNTIKKIEQKIIQNQLKKIRSDIYIKESKNNNYQDDILDNDDLLYQQNFLSFSKFFFVTLTLKKDVSLGYKLIYVKKIKYLLKNLSTEDILLKRSKIRSVKTLEMIKEKKEKKEQDNFMNDEDLYSDKSKSNSLLDITDKSDNKLVFESSGDCNIEKEKEKEEEPIKPLLNIKKNKSTEIKSSNILYFMKSSLNDYYPYLNIIELNKLGTPQFSLMCAFILELEASNHGINNNIFTILKLYERSYIMNDLEFAYNNFYNVLQKLDYLMLHSYYMNIIENKEYDNLKMREYSNMVYLILKQLQTQEKGLVRRVRIFKTMKINSTRDTFIHELQKRYSKKLNLLSNKDITQYQNLMPNDKNFINISLYHYINIRKNSEQEGNNPLKMNILNMYKKYRRTNKDPSQLIEEIAILIFLFILQKSLHKLQPEVITPKFLSNLSNTPEFQKIKDSVAELQVIDLNYLLNVKDNHKTSFWLNTLNFLVIFAVIYRKENLSTNYEWYKLKKNSYFNIGGFNFSLQEIETNILGNNNKAKNFYEEMSSFPKGDSRNKFKIDNVVKYANFGIFEPMSFSFKLQIYFPETIEKQIIKNTIDYFSNKIIFDGKNILIKIPEYLIWIDDKFIKNLEFYKPIINKDLYDFMNKNKEKIEVIKHDWSLNFSHSIV